MLKFEVKDKFTLFKTHDIKYSVPDVTSNKYFSYSTSKGFRYNEIVTEDDFTWIKSIPASEACLAMGIKVPDDIDSTSLVNMPKTILELSKQFDVEPGEEITFLFYGIEFLLKNGMISGPAQVFMDYFYQESISPTSEDYKICIITTPDFKGFNYHDQLFTTVFSDTTSEEYQNKVKEVLGLDNTYGLTLTEAYKYSDVEDKYDLVSQIFTDLKFIRPFEDPDSVYIKPAIEEWFNIEKIVRQKNPKLSTNGLILVGPPGTGKSITASFIGQKLGIPTVRFNISEIMQSYVGSSARNMSKFIESIKRIGQCVLFIDEMDKVFDNQNSSSKSHREVLGLLLSFLNDNKTALVIATCNSTLAFPKELIRPGRFDKVIEVKNIETIEEANVLTELFFKKYLPKEVYEGFDYSNNSTSLLNTSPSDLEQTVKNIARDKFSQSVFTGKIEPVNIFEFKKHLKQTRKEADIRQIC